MKGTWRVKSIAAKNITLKPNAGETISLQVGDKWQGIYRFDSVSVKNTTLVSLDPIESGDQTVSGTVITSKVRAENLRITPSSVLKHAQGESLDITVTGELTVDANAFIDLNNLGYAGGASYPDVLPLPGSLNGGTHMGHGGFNANPVAPTYGSVYQPAEAGAGGQRGGNTGSFGGGILRIQAGTLTNNGTIRANGNNPNDAPAGGSIWITAAQIGGTGVIEARGGNGDRSGGGGAVAIEYTTSSGTVLDTANAFGGTTGTVGGAGTVYLKSAAASYGSLRIDNGSILGSTTLPSLGSGTALTGTSGAILVTGSNVPLYFGAHWVRVTGTDNVVKGTWRVKSIAGKNITLKPNAAETISLQAGDKWQGIYLFDTVTVKNTTLVSLDPIETAEQVLNGAITANAVHATNLRLATGTVLKHAAGKTLEIDVAGELIIDAGASIDVTDLGYGASTSYPDALPLPGSLNGGTHIGQGGRNADPEAPVYGSVLHPAEYGAGGQRNGSGGGVVRIKAGTLTNNGFIRANGRNTNDAPAGGSIWITATNVGGIGTIEARGGNGDRSGGGGAVAIEYTSSSGTVLDNTNAFGGTTGPTGGPGTVYLKPASATYGNLRIDNGTTLNGKTTLPSLGKGTAADGTSGAMLNTGLAAVPLYFERHWVRVSDAAGNVKGTWRIARIDPINRALVELEPNGSETIDLQPGDLWQGLYRFDSVSIRNTTLTSFDPIESVDQTLTSNVVTSDIRTQNLRLTTGTVLKHPQGGKLEISATGEVLIDANAFIDANSLGYTASVSYPGATTPGSLNGGSHMGYGGFNATPIASVFGSLYRPSELGGGGQRNGNGGGIIRIKAGTLTNNGVIRANGNGTNDAPAGGSIWITATNLAGTGTVEAKGGQGDRSGGGGAVAVEYTTVTGPFLSNIFAYGGTSGTIGGAGTVYLKPASGTYGNLSILNGGVNGQSTGLPSLGTGTVKSVSGNAVVVTDRTSDIQPYFVGHWVEIKPAAGGDPKGTWRISAISGKTMTLAPNATESINVQAGDLYQGVYRFDNVTMRTTKVILGDPIRSTNPSDSGTTVIDLNAAPPDFPAAKRSQIVVASALTGDAVTAPAGAVTDPQTPIALVVTNNNSGATFTATANADGSFSVPVVGAAGHTFTVSATDAHVMPLSSSVQVNGAIVELNRVASLQVQPSTVTGGTTAFGTVRLIAPARASGVIVTLSSSASNVAAVPASVAIAGGASSAQFAIATSSPASTTAVQITATLMGASQSASLTITPDSTALVDVVLTSSTVEGGTSVDGTVVLGGPAPPGGALVMLSSTIPEAAAVPSTVLVPEGSSTAGFTITTSKVAAPVRTSITATWGASKAKDLDLTKCTAMTTATPPVSATMNTVWFDDAAPTGATASGDATFDSTQTATGTMALHFTASTAIRAWTFTGATALSVAPADRLVLYALVNPCNPPREILVQWSDATTQYRASWGEQRIGPRDDAKLYAGSLPVGGVWQRLEVIAKTLPSFPTTAKSFTGMTVSVDGGEAWIDTAGVASCSTAKAAKPSYLANETVWFDDAIPAGAVPSTTFNWDTAQVASGTSADLVGAPTDTGTVQHVFTGATAGFALNVEDVIVTYVFIDPCNPPREVMLQWNDGSNWSRRVYWGENLDNMGGTRQTVEHRRMGSVPEAGKWVRLEVPVSSMLMTGMTVRGMAFTVNGGRVWFDRVAKVPRVNLALGKLATQKTLHQNNPEWTADKVVDGNLDKQNFNHTDNELQTWWEVDLGSVQPIDAIDVWNGNPDCCASRLANFYVLVSDKEFSSKDLATTLSQPGVTAYYYMPKAGLPSPFDISRTGRYVRVQLAGANWLHITEVQVWAPVAPLPVNVAAGRSARQSSTLNGTYLAAQAVNGNALGESPSHTNNELEAWWQVDLGSVQQISTIDIDNDYASDVWPRMSNFYVFVSDDPFADTDKVANLLASPKVSAYYRTGPFNAFRYDINRRGRYVRIQLTGPNFLQPMEVRIWSPSLTIKALAKTPASF
ncbi:MAG: discoidin domain-containing protein [Thermoanaerobaculia bacterium]